MNIMTTQQLLVIGLFLILNAHSLYLFYSDKKRSVKKKYRISEKKLLLSSALLGGVGAWVGMSVFRHKTNHSLFKVSVPISALLTLCIVMLSLVFLS